MEYSSNRLICKVIPWLLFCIINSGCGQKSNIAPSVADHKSGQPDELPITEPILEDITDRTGIHFTYRNGEEAGHFAIIESLGGGIAAIDFDGDGKLDLFITGGGYYDGKKVKGYPCRLYRNLGNCQFEDVSDRLHLTGEWSYSHGIAVTDYNNDGWSDLLITGYNRLILLKNVPGKNGGRAFIESTNEAKLTDIAWSSCAGFADFDGDGYPDLYISRYGDWGFDKNHPLDCTYRDNIRDVCQPRKFEPLQHDVYRNNTDGTFTKITTDLKLSKDGRGIGVLVVDVNNDTKPDIYVANDTTANYLYINRSKPGKIILEESAFAAGCALDGRGQPNGSMGVAAADYNRTGKASILVTTYENELPALHRNDSKPGTVDFSNATNASGLGLVGGNYVSWGVGFADFEHRGWEDIVIVSGHAIRFPLAQFGRQQQPLLLQNNRGRFALNNLAGGKYFNTLHNARGLTLADLDNDGNIDLVISHLNEPVVVLRNIIKSENRWVGFELQGKNHRDIVGSRVVLESAGISQTRFAQAGGSFASSPDRRLVFGLGTSAKIDKVKVFWANTNANTAEEFTTIETNGYYRLQEGNSQATKMYQP